MLGLLDYVKALALDGEVLGDTIDSVPSLGIEYFAWNDQYAAPMVTHSLQPVDHVVARTITLLGQGPLHVEKGGKFWNPVHRYKQTVTTV